MTDDPLKPGSRAGIDDSDFTVIPWRKHEIIVALCVTHGFTALLFMVIGLLIQGHK